MKAKFSIPFIACVLFCFVAIAQPDVPVDLLTGRPQVSVPVWQVSFGRLSAPIALVYNGTGVKVEETEGTAGMGWNLVAGGAISRELRGLPDDFAGSQNNATDTRLGWLFATPQQISTYTFSADNNTAVCADEQLDFNFLQEYAYTKDSEPDIFSFNAPGLSGQFVFGADLLPKPIPYQDIKIELSRVNNGPITSYIITKNDGVKYYFTVTESVTRQARLYGGGSEPTVMVTNRELYKKTATYFSSWKLSKIESPAGESIDLTYGIPRTVASITDVEVYEQLTPNGSVSTKKQLYYLQDYRSVSELTSISTDATLVTFVWERPAQLIREISIQDKTTSTVKKFLMSYAYVKNSGDVTGLKTRSFLNAVNEQNSVCNSYPAYKFDYWDVTYGASNTTSLPFNDDKKKQDYWGYYNATATSKIPTIYFYSFKPGAERYRFYPLSVAATSTLTGADRSVNTATVINGALKKVTYPTGGSVTITYQSNDYYDSETLATQLGGGIRVQQVSIDEGLTGSPSIVRTYEYKTATNTSSGKLVNRPAFAFHNISTMVVSENNLATETDLFYERVKVSQSGKGYSIYEYDLPAMFPATAAGASLVKVARFPTCISLGEMKSDYYQYPFAPNTNYDFERGLVRFISDYNQAGLLIAQKEYNYQYLPNTSSLNVFGVRYEKLSNVYMSSKYTVRTNMGKVILTEIQRVADMTTPTQMLTTTSTYAFSSVHNLLSTITQLNSDNTTFKSRFKYAKDFSAAATNPGDEFINGLVKLNAAFMHGTVVETINSVIKSSVETITAANLTLFKTFTNRALPSQQLVYNGTTGFAESSLTGVAPSQSISRAAYRPTLFIDEYDDVGNALTMHDPKLTKMGSLMGYAKSVPVLSVANAASNEVIFSNFESPTGRELTTPAATYTTGFTGKQAFNFTASTVQKDVTKGKGKYRYAFRVSGPSAATITLSLWNGVTQFNTVALNYTTTGQWKLFEGLLDVAAGNATFTVKLATNVGVSLDDFVFYPETAEVNFATYDPIYGKTSETDTRYVTTFWKYDVLGRLVEVKDQDQNVRQVTDYKYNAETKPAFSFFISATPSGQIVPGMGVTLSASPNCATAPTYSWSIDGVQVGTASNVYYTFPTEKKYKVVLTITDPVLGSKSEPEEYDVIAPVSNPTDPITVNVTSDDNTYSYTNCDDPNKYFTAAISGCTAGVSYQWYYLIGGGSCNDTGWVSSGSNLATFSYNGLQQSFSVKCVVTSGSSCTPITTACSVANITYTPGQNCY